MCQDFSNEFLLSEFEALQDRAVETEKSKSSRINFLLILTGAIAAGIGQILSISLLHSYSELVIFICCTVLLLLGIFTLDHSVLDSISVVILYRRMGRIRLWFVNKNPDIGNYVPYQFGDDRPRMDSPFLSFRGGEAVIFTINMIAFCGMVSILLHPPTTLLAIILVVSSCVISWLGQAFFVHIRLKKGEKMASGSIRFPYAKMYEELMK